jgi:hypothetical protein
MTIYIVLVFSKVREEIHRLHLSSTIMSINVDADDLSNKQLHTGKDDDADQNEDNDDNFTGE